MRKRGTVVTKSLLISIIAVALVIIGIFGYNVIISQDLLVPDGGDGDGGNVEGDGFQGDDIVGEDQYDDSEDETILDIILGGGRSSSSGSSSSGSSGGPDPPPDPVCGDGTINVAGEECDDGNTVGQDGCSADCLLELKVEIIHPEEKTYISLGEFDLNFTIRNLTEEIDVCWYTLDEGGSNVSIGDCQNTTFDISEEGSYNLTLEVNTTSGNETNDSVGFSVGGDSVECGDGIDNDGDGLIDWQYDLGCWGPEDDSETAEPREQENGWTTFDPVTGSANPDDDSIIVYVSSSSGNDGYDGYCPESDGQDCGPKATIVAGKALIRHEFPDWLLLKRGDVWTDESLEHWKTSGRNADEVQLIGSYGADLERPLLQTGSQTGFYTQGGGGAPLTRSNIAIVGIHFQAHTYDGTGGPTGIRWLRQGENFLVEDCYIEGYRNNIVVQYGVEYKGLSNFSLRRCVIVDSYSTNGHSQGMYMTTVQDLLIEECLFDHNGWNDNVEGAEPTIFNHNVYSRHINHSIVQNNIFSRGSSFGLTMTADNGTASVNDALIDNNLFVANANTFVHGTDDSDYSVVDSRLTNNVVTEGGRDIPPIGPQSFGMEFTNADGQIVTDNLFVHKTFGGTSFAIRFDTDQLFANVNVQDNIVYDWVDGTITPEEEIQGTDITVANNQIDMPPSTYYDPDRTVGRYDTDILGGDGTIESLMTEARKQSRFNWRPEYTADAVNDYIREGFEDAGEPGDCVLDDAYWNTTESVEGDLVELTVEGINCDGQEVSFDIKEDDLLGDDDDVLVLPDNAVFSGGLAVTTWVSEYQEDWFQDPEYYFNGSLMLDPGVSIISNNILRVTEIITNNPPVLDLIGDKIVDEGQLLEFTLGWTDPDGHGVSCEASNLPLGAVFNDVACTFSWTPGIDQSGIYLDVLFNITDDGVPPMSDFELIDITVNDVPVPSVDILSPLEGETVYVSDVEVDFNVNDWVIGGIGQDRIRFYLDSDGVPYDFYNGGDNVVYYGGAPASDATWIDENIIRFDGLSDEVHDVRAILTDSGGNELVNPEAEDTVQFTVEASGGIPLNDCGILDQAGELYVLQNDIITSGVCFNITVNNIILEGAGFTITGDDETGAGVYAEDVSGLQIKNINIEYFRRGIHFQAVDSSLIENVFATESGSNFSGSGIMMKCVTNSIIRESRFLHNDDGIHIGGCLSDSEIIYSMNNTIIDNEVDFNTDGVTNYGIITSGNYTYIINNSASSNEVGIFVDGFHNLIQGNTANLNVDEGIVIRDAHNVIIDNTANLNTDGLFIRCSGTFSKACNHTAIGNSLYNNGDGMNLLAVYDSRFMNNTIVSSSVNGLQFSTSSYYEAPTGSFNEFSDMVIDNSGEDAILIVSSITHNAVDNVFTNISVMRTNPLYYDIKFEDTYEEGYGLDGLYLVDTYLDRYYFEGDGVGLVFVEEEGEVEFLERIVGSGENLSRVEIGFNSVKVDSISEPVLDAPANITLYDVPANPVNEILRDGFLCPSVVCYNFTALGPGTVRFNVTGWTNYSIGEPSTLLPACENGEDDDEDGWFDWPYDPGCIDISDNSEDNSNLGECADNIDNEVVPDGSIDGYDPMCKTWEGVTETAQCQDGLDNDNDGLTDWPEDPSCFDANDDIEAGYVLTDCGILGDEGLYVLYNDIEVVGSCFGIIADNVILDGNGFSVIGDFETGGVAINGNNLVNISLRNLNLRNFVMGDAMGGVINISHVDDLVIFNNTIDSNKGDAVNVRYGDNVVIKNNLASDNQPGGDGFRLSDCNNSLVLDNVAIGNAYRGVFLARSNNTQIINNSLVLNDGFFGAGVALSGSSDVLIEGNDISNNSGYHGYGVEFYNEKCEKVQIINNVISGNEKYGVDLHSLNRNVSIENNYIGENDYGVFIHTYNPGVRVINNTISGNTGNGVYAYYSGDHFIENNTARFNGGYGVYLNYHSSDSSIVNNDMSDNVGGGLMIFNSHREIIRDNAFNDNIGSGIQLDAGASRNVIANNTIHNNNIGMNLQAEQPYNGPHFNLIENNTITSSAQEGLYLTQAYNNTIKNLIIDGSGRDAIYVYHLDSDYNIFENVVVSNTNPAYKDIVVYTDFFPDIGGTEFIDTYFGAYDFSGMLDVSFMDTEEGRIEFLEDVSGASGDNLSSDVNIGYNLASVDSENVPEFNKQAGIELYGLPDFTDPIILRNGVECPSEICTLVGFEDGTAIFEVTGWTDYSIGESGASPLPPDGGDADVELSPPKRSLMDIILRRTILGRVVDEEIIEETVEHEEEGVGENEIREGRADIRGESIVIDNESKITGRVIGGVMKGRDLVLIVSSLIILVILLVLSITRNKAIRRRRRARFYRGVNRRGRV